MPMEAEMELLVDLARSVSQIQLLLAGSSDLVKAYLGGLKELLDHVRYTMVDRAFDEVRVSHPALAAYAMDPAFGRPMPHFFP